MLYQFQHVILVNILCSVRKLVRNNNVISISIGSTQKPTNTTEIIANETENILQAI